MNGHLTKESLVCFIEGRGQLCASNGPDNLHDMNLMSIPRAPPM